MIFFEVINTSPIVRRHKGLFVDQHWHYNLGFRKDELFTYSSSVPLGLSISVGLSSFRRRGRPCLSIVYLPGGGEGGGGNAPSQVARFLISGVLN